MVRKVVGKTLDYFFGVGDKEDYYNLARKYYWAFEDESIRKREEYLLKQYKISKIIVKVSMDVAQTIGIYSAITQRDYVPLLLLPILEIPKIIISLADCYGKKRILKDKNIALENLFHSEQPEEESRQRKTDSYIDPADWWKK